MESLFRKVRKSPQNSGGGKHSKLGEGWAENTEAVTEGVGFYLKYLGSTLLEELPLGDSYGEGESTKAVQRIVDMARTLGKKLDRVSLKVAPTGIRVLNMDTKQLVIDVSIYRISFCTADKNHDKVFAFIARNTINETMECHAFYCAKQKIAQAVTVSVSQAFNLARDQWEKTNNKKNSLQNKSSKDEQNQRLADGDSLKVPAIPPRNLQHVQSAPQIHFTDTHPRLPKPESTTSLKIEDRSASPRQGWQTFDESSEPAFNSDDENNDSSESLDDCFSQLAENRVRPTPSENISSTSFPIFSTNLRKEDLDASVQEYMDGGTKCLEAFSKTSSFEDLLNL